MLLTQVTALFSTNQTCGACSRCKRRYVLDRMLYRWGIDVPINSNPAIDILTLMALALARSTPLPLDANKAICTACMYNHDQLIVYALYGIYRSMYWKGGVGSPAALAADYSGRPTRYLSRSGHLSPAPLIYTSTRRLFLGLDCQRDLHHSIFFPCCVTPFLFFKTQSLACRRVSAGADVGAPGYDMSARTIHIRSSSTCSTSVIPFIQTAPCVPSGYTFIRQHIHSLPDTTVPGQ